ncbi:DNA cytosine methyltransferase [Brevundimonas sp.]|uniref:DNA cytosine methyltransferase n=1 Tax=Brevundimonas sp. TaxID=1871086 RepID=UPI0035B15211
MIYGSVCSGIEAASVAWHPLGWRASFLSEIEAFPRAVLSHHYPEVPLHGDFTTIAADQYEPIDLLVGGTPCQSFSVAGLRGGLDDDRGNLALEYLRLADRLRPRWLVWENVPGVLSSNGGRDFGAILGGMVELGYGFAYRVLDAQFFGVAQRRRRVFVVGHLGDWRCAAAVLFERHSLSGHLAPRREAGEGAAPTIGASSGDWSRDNIGESLVPFGLSTQQEPKWASDLSPTLTIPSKSGGGQPTAVAFALRGRDGGAMPEIEGHGERAGALRAASGGSSRDYVAFAQNTRDEVREMPYVGALAADPGMKQTSYIRGGSAVRRLTPRECERLQGFPDDYTLIPYRKGMAADGPRYKALGNSMAVPVMAWIGQRIAAVDAIIQSERLAA